MNQDQSAKDMKKTSMESILEDTKMAYDQDMVHSNGITEKYMKAIGRMG
jgi:hypothetical protein